MDYLILVGRNLWSKATDISKTALDEKDSLIKAVDLTSTVSKLEKAMLAYEPFEASAWASIACVKDVINMLSDPKRNQAFTEEQASTANALFDAKNSLLQQMPDFPSTINSLTGFCEAQWANDATRTSLETLVVDDSQDITNQLFLASAYTGQVQLV